jgi:hypothetical protein
LNINSNKVISVKITNGLSPHERAVKGKITKERQANNKQRQETNAKIDDLLKISKAK